MQRGDEAGRILARRIAQRDQPDQVQRVLRARGDGDDPVSMPGEIVDLARARQAPPPPCNDLECALDDAQLAPVAIDRDGLGRLGRRIERDETRQPFGRAVDPLASASRANGGVDRVLVRLGARQCRKRQHALAIKARHGDDVDDLQRVARQCSGLVGAQHVHGGGLVRGREAGQQNSAPGQGSARRMRPTA